MKHVILILFILAIPGHIQAQELDRIEMPWLHDLPTVHAAQEGVLEDGKLYYGEPAPYTDFPAIKMLSFPHNQLRQALWVPTYREDSTAYEKEFLELARQHKLRFGDPTMPFEGRRVYFWYQEPTAMYLGYNDQWSLRYNYQPQ